MIKRLSVKILTLWQRFSGRLTSLDESGAALVTSILFVTVIGIGALVATQWATTDIKHTKKYIQSREAFYIAEAGIQKALNYLNYDESGNSGECVPGGDGSCAHKHGAIG